MIDRELLRTNVFGGLKGATAAEVAEIAMKAKSKVKRRGTRAVTDLSVVEIVALAWIADLFLEDHPEILAVPAAKSPDAPAGASDTPRAPAGAPNPTLMKGDPDG